MDLISILALLIVLSVAAVMVYGKLRSDERAFSRLYQPVDEHLLDDDSDLGKQGLIAFAGESEFTTESFTLAAGHYKLTYRFPAGVLTRVELASHDGTDHETLVIAQGEGQSGFETAAGRYFCVIEPAENDTSWEIEITPLARGAALPAS